jgi:hypothetical protein
MAPKTTGRLSVAGIKGMAADIPQNEAWIRQKAHRIYEQREALKIPGDAESDWEQAVGEWDMRVERSIVEAYLKLCKNPEEKLRWLTIFMVSLFRMEKPSKVDEGAPPFGGANIDQKFVSKMFFSTIGLVAGFSFRAPAKLGTVGEFIATLVQQYNARAKPRKKTGKNKKRP